MNLHNFTNGTDGSVPHSLVISGSTLYGTTLGLSGNGTVFALGTNGMGFTTLHSFPATNFIFSQGGPGPAPGYTNSDGVGPTGLTLSGDILYGTAYLGGTNGNGTIFALNTNGTGFTTLHSFAASSLDSSGVYVNSDGAHPIAFTGLILSSNTLYGTANYGGNAGNGTVFAINTNGTGFTTLYSFTATNSITGANNDGANPYAGLILSSNTLYGTAISGGNAGAGTVFSISLALAVTTTSLPNGTSGVAYSQNLAAFGGQKPYVWTNISGALPPGLGLANSGVISGMPTTNGIYTFTVNVVDAVNNTAMQTLTLAVIGLPGVVIQPTNNPITVIVGSSVTFYTSVAGTGPFNYQWQHDGTNLPNRIISTVAGGGNSGLGDGGVAIKAELYDPESVAVDASGKIFIADRGNNRVREVTTNGVIITVAGGGNSGLGDGGAATGAELNQPDGVAIDASGNLFVADRYNQRIRKVGVDGIITTVAGNGYGSGTDSGGYSGDGGPATNAELNVPVGIAVDLSNNIFIADMNNQRVRKVDIFGTISTVAGNGYTNQYGQGGFSGDGGLATNAELNYPVSVALDATGNLLISDSLNNIVRNVGTNGIINTLAGNRIGNFRGDGGSAINAELYSPSGVALDGMGNLFIADELNWRIREVGTNGIITTVAGNGTNGYIGDGGSATNAELAYPCGVTVDALGNLLIADSANNCIRKVVFSGATLELNDVSFGDAGSYDVVVSSPFGCVTSSVVNLSIQLPPPLQVATTTLPNGVTGAVYSQQLCAIYGQLPFSWAISSGLLPSGLTLTANGLIAGTPTVAGIASFTVTVTDALSATALEPLSFTISTSNNLCVFVPLYEFSAVDATSFTNSDGASPLSGLTLSGNTLYGTTCYGGTSANGSVFSIQTNNTGFRNFYSFTGGNDGACPSGGLILASNILFGTTQFGGSNGYGSIFAIATSGTLFTNLYGFTASYTNSTGVYTNSDGAIPQGGLLLLGDTMYGTTSQGGRNGNGTVFSIKTNGSSFKNIYIFTKTSDYDYNGGTNKDGAYPIATLVSVGDSLFGTTYYGGTSGNGTVFRVNMDGICFTNLYDFTALDPIFSTNKDGANPWGGLILSGSILYGTACYGGDFGYGTIFAINTDGTGFANLYNFCDGGDGAFPQDGLILSNYTLYGTTTLGGDNNNGTVFAININGSGFTNLYSFNGESDGSTPNAPLTLWGNTMYGTANEGGNSGNGMVFSISLLPVENIVNSPLVLLSLPQINLGKTNFTFQLSGPAGSNYVLQVSTNLLNWSSVSTSAIPVNGTTNLANPISNYNHRFYRAVIP